MRETSFASCDRDWRGSLSPPSRPHPTRARGFVTPAVTDLVWAQHAVVAPQTFGEGSAGRALLAWSRRESQRSRRLQGGGTVFQMAASAPACMHACAS